MLIVNKYKPVTAHMRHRGACWLLIWLLLAERIWATPSLDFGPAISMACFIAAIITAYHLLSQIRATRYQLDFQEFFGCFPSASQPEQAAIDQKLTYMSREIEQVIWSKDHARRDREVRQRQNEAILLNLNFNRAKDAADYFGFAVRPDRQDYLRLVASPTQPMKVVHL